MFEPRIKIDRELYARLRQAALTLGYATVDEYILHILEGAASGDADDEVSAEDMRERLRGLGYLE